MKALLLGTISIFLLSCKSQHTTSYPWRVLEKPEAVDKETPSRFLTYQLKEEVIHTILDKVGSTKESHQKMTIPDPQGHFKTFKVWKSRTLSETLAKKFPDLSTYQGVSINSEAVKVRLEKTTAGFQYMVFDKEDTWFITPVPQRPSTYWVYFKRDLPEGSKPQWKEKLSN